MSLYTWTNRRRNTVRVDRPDADHIQITVDTTEPGVLTSGLATQVAAAARQMAKAGYTDGQYIKSSGYHRQDDGGTWHTGSVRTYWRQGVGIERKYGP